MPSVTDVQQQSSKISSNNNGKSTPPPQQQTSSISTDANNNDPMIQALLMLEKKQRNLGKRKEKLESYEQEEKSGKELHKDQKEALAKYGEVIGQIECAKDIYEQLKKIQNETAKNQKRLFKQATEEKRIQMGQRLREFAQLRYLLDHRPESLKTEESSLLDELARVIIPSDVSINTISRCVDTVLSIYQGGSLSSVIKNLTRRNCQEVREILEQLIKQIESSSNQVIPNISSNSLLPQQHQQQQQQNNDEKESSLTSIEQQPLSNLTDSTSTEYPLQFDTRNQNIPLQQIIQDNPFFSLDNVNQDKQQSEDTKQYYTIINSNMTSQPPPAQTYTKTSSISSQQQGGNTYDQENLSNVVSSGNVPNDEQQSEEQWQQPRGNANRGGQYNENPNKNYNRPPNNNYNQQQQWRPRGGHFDGSYGGGQRQYNENNNRGGGGGQRGGPNPNYRGHRGGNYRGGNRGGGGAGYNGNGNDYQKSGQYQQNNEQQVRSGPPSQQQ